MTTRRSFLKSTAALAAFGVATRSGLTLAESDTIYMGSKDFTEQFILGHMYMEVLKAKGLNVEDKMNLGGTQVAHKALTSGDISLYPEYTGTGLTEVLKKTVADAAGGATPSASPAASPAAGGGQSQAVYDFVKKEYESQFKLTWLDRSPANNTQALAVKKSFSEEKGITTISQLAEVADQYIISAPADFPEREDGLLGLQKVYGDGFKKIEVLPVSPGLKYQALQNDEAQVVLAFGTDGQISGYDLVLLKDDKSLWPPYNVAPVVRDDVLAAHPEIADALNGVTKLLTDEVLSGLNWKVDGDEKKEPADVAKDFLKEQGLIS